MFYRGCEQRVTACPRPGQLGFIADRPDQWVPELVSWLRHQLDPGDQVGGGQVIEVESGDRLEDLHVGETEPHADDCRGIQDLLSCNGSRSMREASTVWTVAGTAMVSGSAQPGDCRCRPRNARPASSLMISSTKKDYRRPPRRCVRQVLARLHCGRGVGRPDVRSALTPADSARSWTSQYRAAVPDTRAGSCNTAVDLVPASSPKNSATAPSLALSTQCASSTTNTVGVSRLRTTRAIRLMSRRRWVLAVNGVGVETDSPSESMP